MKSELVSITSTGMALHSCVEFASGNYVLKPYKWNKENVKVMFGSYVRIILGTCVRLTGQMGSKNYVVITFGSYVRITLEKSR